MRCLIQVQRRMAIRAKSLAEVVGSLIVHEEEAAGKQKVAGSPFLQQLCITRAADQSCPDLASPFRQRAEKYREVCERIPLTTINQLEI
ncbi:MAG: hypothetical protein AB7K24_24430 [Gemmataceae bacterium]